MKPEEKIVIASNEDLTYLINRFCNGPAFAAAFVFDCIDLYNRFFAAANIDVNTFQEKYYYYDAEKNIHISESENGYVWISTMGLVAKSKITADKFINACNCQKIVLTHLLDDAIALCTDESSHDIDSYSYYMIEQLTPALFHNTIFYFETLAKALLSINGKTVPHTHKLESLLELVKKTMFEKHQNNTLLHAQIIPMIEETVHHIASIPGKFKEEYVKYGDNPQDTTVIAFHFDLLKNMRDLVEISHDIVTEMYYNPKDCLYLGTGLYQRLLEKCETAEALKRIEETCSFLLDQQ